MKWYNALLNLDFLTGDFVNILKELSFAACVGIIILAIIALIYGSLKEHTVLHNVFTVILISYIVAYIILLVVLALGLFSYPAAFMGTLLKNFIITKYSLLFLSTFQEIILNIIVAFICCLVWFGFLLSLIMQYGKNVPEMDE